MDGQAQTLDAPQALLPIGHTWVSLTLDHPGSGDCILGGGKGRAQWASVFGVNPHRWVNSPLVPPHWFLWDAWASVVFSGPCGTSGPISPLHTTQTYLSSSNN